jgi:hypothetical protein
MCSCLEPFEWLRAVSDNRYVAIAWGADGKSGTLVDVLLAGLIRDGINNRTG